MTTSEMSAVAQVVPPATGPSRGSGRAPEVDRKARASELRRSPYPPLVGSVIQRAANVLVAGWDRALVDVQGVQERQLRELLDHAKDTEFGRAHGFSSIRTHAEYVRQVPIGDYDTFSPYIDRMRAGERNLLVPEFVRYFGNSSGSSNQGKPKFLPITDRQIRLQQKAGTDTVMRYLSWSGNTALFGGGYTLGLFPAITMKAEGPVLITSNPALMMTKMPAITKPCYLPEDDIRRVADYDKKLGILAERYLDWDIHAVTGTTCWFTLLFEKVLAEAQEAREKSPLRGRHLAEPAGPVRRRSVGSAVSAGHP